ncbi:hypothetical protein DFQ01_15014 [Paenibacillus cellulosilyticus]|uniref:Uncharacterized protein n=1 Tax=Paenibacillus cellulosilyticus TaxID=375489 RepID=A0A2V2YAV1_9BACL|nr:hypothetical protein [Paenibacillus cellulosilyticus]PWV88465.1 hypothetical protein DFQ01_15014 [Paenibacillus cellulosilyticus]QKS44098.1 hypothetical protein HUB94_06395 [Paenibacillus cellulosilyticus]
MHLQPLSIYYIKLKLKSPTDEALSEGLKPYADDVYEAMENFNVKFNGIKKITVLKVNGIGLDLFLFYYNIHPIKVTAKELTVFSRYLYYEKNWSRFSRESSKLFVPAGEIIDDFPLAEAYHEIFVTQDDTDRKRDASSSLRKKYPSLYPEDILEYYYSSENIYAQDDDSLEVKNMDYESMPFELTEAQSLATLNFLLQTKDLGSIELANAKREAIQNINSILRPWASGTM